MSEENKIRRLEPLVRQPNGSRVSKGKPSTASEDSVDLRAFFRIVQKRRWTILTPVCVIFTLVLIGVVKERPVYRAEGMLEIGPENQNTVTVQELFQLENVSRDYLETQYRILQSDTLARDVIAQLHLDDLEEFNPTVRLRAKEVRESDDGRKPTSAKDWATEQAVLERFAARLNVIPIRQSRLVRMTFESYDPQLAANVVNSFGERYIQENLQAHWTAAQKASEWLSQQLEGLKIKLERSEDELQRYARGNNLLFLETGKGGTQNIVNERLQQLQDELTQAEAERYQKESLYRLAEAGDLSSLPGIADSKLVQDLTLQLTSLEQEKAELGPNFTADYPKMKTIQSQIDQIQRSLEQQRRQAAEHIAGEFQAAVHREAMLRSAFDEQQKQAHQAAERTVQYSILKREVDTNKQLYDDLLQRLKEAGVSAGVKASNIRVVDSAVPPSHPFKPRVALNLSLALAVGFVFGVVLGLFREHLDNTLKTPDDVEQFLRVPALALIPSRLSLERRRNGHRNPLTALAAAGTNGKNGALHATNGSQWFRIDAEMEPHAALSEAFRGLRTSVLLSTAGRPPRSLVFISAEPGEGKTTTCCNLAICLAQLGKRVLLIDTDMRRPSVHRFFGLSASAGVVNYLTGDRDWLSLMQNSGLPGLDCAVCGPVPPNPSEIISSSRMETLLREAMGKYDFVLCDSPPLLSVADGRILATMVEGAILVVKGGATPRELVRHAQLLASDVGARLIGVVLNGVNIHADDYYYSRYYYYRAYSEEAANVAPQ